jgi:uncharacterized protein (TIGR02246 family)
MNGNNERIVSEIVSNLEKAWNAADGTGFAQPFAEDADFVNIRADHFHTRAVIAQGHQGIFDTIYKGSVVRYQLASVREISPKVLLAHVKATLRVPTGPMAGEMDALYSLVLVQNGNDWHIAAFHNTLVAK